MKSKYCLISFAHEVSTHQFDFRSVVYEGPASQWLIETLEKGFDVALLNSEPITHAQYKRFVNIIETRTKINDSLHTAYQQDVNKNIN